MYPGPQRLEDMISIRDALRQISQDNEPITYDAKDPNTSFPPIEPLRPPKGHPTS